MLLSRLLCKQLADIYLDPFIRKERLKQLLFINRLETSDLDLFRFKERNVIRLDPH